MITRSEGLFVAECGDTLFVFDPVTRTAHVADGVAAWLLASDDPADLDSLIGEFAATTGGDTALAAQTVRRVGDELTAAGLLGRTGAGERPEPLMLGIEAPEPGWAVGHTHPYLDRRLAFCGPDADLIGRIDAFLDPTPQSDPPLGSDGPADGVAPTGYFGIIPLATGQVDLIDTTNWRFPSADHLIWQLPGALNLYVGRSDTMPILHAGGVRLPSGRIVVVTGPVNAGKSTLVAALVRAGCDYLSDESIGVDPDTLDAWGYPKPLSLNARSQAMVGLDPPTEPVSADAHRHCDAIRSGAQGLAGAVGPVDLIVRTEFAPGAPARAERLTPAQALHMLLENYLNPLRARQHGLGTLSRLVESTPTVHVTHADGIALAELIVATDAAPEALTA